MKQSDVEFNSEQKILHKYFIRKKFRHTMHIAFFFMPKCSVFRQKQNKWTKNLTSASTLRGFSIITLSRKRTMIIFRFLTIIETFCSKLLPTFNRFKTCRVFHIKNKFSRMSLQHDA